MTDAQREDQRIHSIATANPVRSLATRLGELKEQADREVANLETTLRHIDETKQLLNAHGLAMTVDLGDVGNAAAHARRAAVADATTATFALPGAA